MKIGANLSMDASGKMAWNILFCEKHYLY